MMYIDIVNHSGHPMENLEVKYPTGIFGLPELRDEQTHRHMVPIGTPCKFSIKFEDQTGKTYTGDYDFGAKCPTEVAFEVGAGMNVSAEDGSPVAGIAVLLGQCAVDGGANRSQQFFFVSQTGGDRWARESAPRSRPAGAPVLPFGHAS